MKKGLSVLLEQRPDPVRPPILDTDSTEEQGSSGQGGNEVTPTPTPTPTQGPNFEETLNQRMSDMFNVFDVFDGNDTELVKKLSDSDMDAIKGNVIRRLKGKFGDNLSDMDLSILDDTFINYMVDYMIDNKNMEPFYIRYIPTNVYKITPKRIVEAIGLMKVLVEQGLTTDRETLYVNYTPSGGFEIIGGAGARNQASANFRSQKGNDDIQARETSGRQRQASQTPQQPTQPERRPEEEMGVNPKAEMIQKKAESEGVQTIYDNLPEDLQKTLDEYLNGQGYQTDKPNDQVIDNYEVIDLVKKESSFKDKGFKTFPLWRLNPNITEDDGAFQRFAGMLEKYTPDRDMCKTIAQMYEKNAELDVPNATEDIQRHANYLTRCRRKNFKYMDFGKTKKLIDSFQSELGSRPRYQINYSTGKAGS